MSSTEVRHIDGIDGALHDMTLGAANMRPVRRFATANRVTTGSGDAGRIDRVRCDTATVNSGGAGRVQTGDRVDGITRRDGGNTQVERTVEAGGIGSARRGDGAQSVTTGTGRAETIGTDRGNDTAIPGSALAAHVWLGGGDDALVLAECPEA